MKLSSKILSSMTVSAEKIRDLEHECEIGLPHDDCWDCGTATLRTPTTHPRHVVMRQARWDEGVAGLLSRAR